MRSVMKIVDLVRRTLADAALVGNRRWASQGDIAFAARCSVAAVYQATRHLSEIGAIHKYGQGGLSVTDPERVVTTLAASRTLRRDVLASTSLDGAQHLISTCDAYALGGTDAALHHLGGPNTVADKGQRLIYVPPGTGLDELPDGSDVLVLPLDAPAARDWKDGFSSPAQTFADLFALPGWQATEFRRALWRKLFAVDDWSNAEVG
ncbi:MAG: hypothetical protein Q8P61_06035 [Candidatus Nanopelagicales bacterium]|nr:hypothetical protein [Candidatus Nanopelagicales bacterium]